MTRLLMRSAMELALPRIVDREAGTRFGDTTEAAAAKLKAGCKERDGTSVLTDEEAVAMVAVLGELAPTVGSVLYYAKVAPVPPGTNGVGHLLASCATESFSKSSPI